jgi:hypothetical protein
MYVARRKLGVARRGGGDYEPVLTTLFVRVCAMGIRLCAN